MPRNNLTYTMRSVEIYIYVTKTKPLSKEVILRLVETLIVYYGQGQRKVIDQLKSEMKKEGIEVKIPSQSTYSIYPNKPDPYKPYPYEPDSNKKVQIKKVSKLKLYVKGNAICRFENQKSNKKIVLQFKVKDKVLPPWYMRDNNKKGIIKLESLLNNNRHQCDEYVEKMVEVIKTCSPEVEYENINRSVGWYKKNINKFTKPTQIKSINRLPFTADLFVFDSEADGDNISADVLIKFQHYLGYYPLKVVIGKCFLDEPGEMYQLVVDKKGCEYKLTLVVKNKKSEIERKYTVTLAIYDKESDAFMKAPDLIPKGIGDDEYTLTKDKSIAMSVVKFDTKQGYEYKQSRKLMGEIDEKLSLSEADQYFVEALKCCELDVKKINSYQYVNDAVEGIKIVQPHSIERPELILTELKGVNTNNKINTYIIKLV